MAAIRSNASCRLGRTFAVAAMLVFVQTVAAAHELQHALHPQENPTCALHLYADHVGKAPTSVVAISLPLQPPDAPIAREPVFVHVVTALRYYTRGPPCSS